MDNKLFIMQGAPGCGKSTFIRKHNLDDYAISRMISVKSSIRIHWFMMRTLDTWLKVMIFHREPVSSRSGWRMTSCLHECAWDRQSYWI